MRRFGEKGYDFDSVVDRSGTNAMAKGGFRDYLFGDEPDEVVLPCSDEAAIAMWVADMGFASVPAAIAGMRARLEHPIFGYSAILDSELFDAFHDWCKSRYGWTPQEEHLVSAAGVVPALHDLVEQHLSPGNKALTLTPAYGFFKHACDYHELSLIHI